jgi:cytochrome c oxidase assembly protein Cox11
MLGLAYAAEPLYKAFCAVTGFGGTTQVATERPKEILDRVVRVYFDTNVETGAPLAFFTATVTVAVHQFASTALRVTPKARTETLTGAATACSAPGLE